MTDKIRQWDLKIHIVQSERSDQEAWNSSQVAEYQIKLRVRGLIWRRGV